LYAILEISSSRKMIYIHQGKTPSLHGTYSINYIPDDREVLEVVLKLNLLLH
jgi:hypothetical protein